jgi:hypothetical protein
MFNRKEFRSSNGIQIVDTIFDRKEDPKTAVMIGNF